MKDGSETCPKYRNGICQVTGKDPEVKLLCGEAYPWTVLMKSYRSCSIYRSQFESKPSKDGYDSAVKPEELGAYTIALAKWICNLPEEEFSIMINRIKLK